jgi:hypothetical protein
MDISRRKLLETTLFGAAGVGLRALATGLPLAAFTRPVEAWAAAPEGVCGIAPERAQFLVMSTSSAGDPANANVPGTYVPDVVHPADPRLAPTPIKLGAETVTGAAAWGALPQWARDRTVFFHHATLTNNHPNHPKVLRLMGATARQEMLASIAAAQLAPCLGTVQTEPISLGAGDVLTFEGRGLPNLRPTGLRDLLTRPTGPVAKLAASRDAHLDRMYALLKERGTKAQRALVDRMALSRGQARALSDDLINMLTGVTSDRSDGQVVAAVVLVRMKVSPVVAIKIDFGGDNHRDEGLAREADETVTGVQRIADLLEGLRQNGLEERVSFLLFNVFGRTLRKLGQAGRDHWGSHHASVLVGKGWRGGVVGGLEPKAGDFYAAPIDARTGRAALGGGDVPFGETMAAMAKTLGRGLGIPQAALDRQVTGGRAIEAVLA